MRNPATVKLERGLLFILTLIYLAFLFFWTVGTLKITAMVYAVSFVQDVSKSLEEDDNA